MRRVFATIALITLLSQAAALRAETVRVATAANFIAPLRQLAAVFERQSGHRVIISSGSSGKLYAQIQRGAPFDLFFSADRDKADKLSAEGLARGQHSYALGRLVLWCADKTQAAQNCLHKDFSGKLAIANPLLAPYGRAALETLRSLGLEQAFAGRLIRGENIGQAFQFLHSGAAGLGFIAQSQWQQGKLAGSAWPVPSHLHRPIRQDFVVLKRASNNSGAKQFAAFIRSDKGRQLIAKFGYDTPSRQTP